MILYQKGGQQKKALELCFSARLFDALRKISEELNAESRPETGFTREIDGKTGVLGPEGVRMGPFHAVSELERLDFKVF